ncbi:MAG TPA: GDSL-type esterase/lipase family protein [Candidatus Saccharimonadaceae bacterium]|nr:GDSL-type esterase/lipase family protein [Candidatus Saccharimonadaceae bacterium]
MTRQNIILKIFYSLSAMGVTTLILTCSVVAAADSTAWVGRTIKYSEVPDQKKFPPTQESCVQKSMILQLSTTDLQPIDICLHERNGWSYGTYKYLEHTYYGNYYQYGDAVRLSAHGPMHRLMSSIAQPAIDVPGSDTLIMMERYNASITNTFNIYKNFPSHLHSQLQPSGEVQYTYDTEPDDRVARVDGSPLSFFSVPGISNNGEWAAGETSDGFVRVNLETFEVKRFSVKKFDYPLGYGPASNFAVSNDGEHIAVGGDYNQYFGSRPGFTVYDISETCGDHIPHQPVALAPGADLCPYEGDEQVFRDNNDGQFDHVANLSFDDSGGRLTMRFYATKNSPGRWVDLTLDGGAATPRVTYLALGDSYSSGEGDITDGETHYLNGTGGKNNCHVSDRSYPFLVRDYYGLAPSAMHSVACSGAQVALDYVGSDSNYLGQNKQLDGIPGAVKTEKRQEALDKFSPGLVKQIDFVKKYKPSIVTFTGGGNDVGFADILMYCASPSISLKIVIIPFTCEYAKKDSKLHQSLYDAIDTQYTYDKLLIQAIKAASPPTRIVVVGYPSFIAISGTIFPVPKLPCNLNGASLNNDEKQMVNDAVHYMDGMLQTLAHDTKVSYVDTEHSLDGGRVCEAGGYVNGIMDVGPLRVVRDSDPSSFHPNAKGQQKLADTIIASGVFDAPQVPEASDYKQNAAAKTTKRASFSEILGSTLKIVASSGTFLAKSSIAMTLHSDPINLGTFTADSDGGISVDIPLRDVPPGDHVLTMDGTGPDGQPITYYEFITVPDPVTDIAQVKQPQSVTQGGQSESASNPVDYGVREKNDKQPEITTNPIQKSDAISPMSNRGSRPKFTQSYVFVVVVAASVLAVVIIVIWRIYHHAKQKS